MRGSGWGMRAILHLLHCAPVCACRYMIPGAHVGPARACAWSLNCRHLVTAGVDGCIGLWDAESGAPLIKMPVKTGALNTCSISPSSLYVATGSLSGARASVCVNQVRAPLCVSVRCTLLCGCAHVLV